jgi:hypothetical protein
MRQGSIVAKRASGRMTWVLRFVVRNGGRSVHRSVLLCGDDEPGLLLRARRLLRHYRSRSAWAEEVALFARVAGAAKATLGRLASGGRPGG